MKIWVIVAIIGMLSIAGFAAVNALAFNDSEDNSYPGYGSCGEPSCDGGCSATNNCGNPTCGARAGGSCGCGAR